MKPGIPKSILAPLARSPWQHDEYSITKFEHCLEVHAEEDRSTGITCKYNLAGTFMATLDAKELAALVKAGAIKADFVDGTWVNQHWLHSLEQFYAVAYREWLAHLKRTDALIGTPAGRIDRKMPR